MKSTRQTLAGYGYRAKKSRGQHFLVRESYLDRIAAAARLEPRETVLEIGPGPGNLTRRLCEDAGRVVAVEVDPELADMLKREVRAENLEIIMADILDLDLASIAPKAGKMKVVANIPYNITTPILFKLLDARALFSELLLLVQKEVAERIAAAPGGKPYGILAAQAQLVADVKIEFKVPPEAFSPRPKVDSALMRLRLLPEPRYPVDDLVVYKRLVRAAFARRRKTLRNSFYEEGGFYDDATVAAALAAAGVDSGRRAETVTVEEFARIANHLAREGNHA